jgi:hypothetical protein
MRQVRDALPWILVTLAVLTATVILAWAMAEQFAP